MNGSPSQLRGKRIIVGLSGGVDSAVAAILLQDQGADVQALHMTNWEDDDGYCTAANDLQDARQICEQLGITLHHVNFAREYRNQVFANFLDEYRAGRTPNPDVLCNREIKFGTFLKYAQRLGGDMIATGHYARTEAVNGDTHLLKAIDLTKDQSYFLHAVSARALAATLFPLGDLCKKDVRNIARDHALTVHAKKDSTGICFIGERPFQEFLATYIPADPGAIRTPDGRTVGEHHGLMYYTLGQRQGLGIGGRRDSGDAPWYVVAKEPGENVLVVVQGEHPLRYHTALEASQASWINAAPSEPLVCTAKIRYRQQDQSCRVILQSNGKLTVSFEVPQTAVAPGQYVVFYDDDRCLGGAVIDRALNSEDAMLMAG
ncbi:MAG: tRNA 2-thiouridine(34) synthase MnmA [Woeseiaceae bacterium]